MYFDLIRCLISRPNIEDLIMIASEDGCARFTVTLVVMRYIYMFSASIFNYRQNVYKVLLINIVCCLILG